MSSGRRFTPLGWVDFAWASEVHVTWPTVGRHLQTENWRPWTAQWWWWWGPRWKLLPVEYLLYSTGRSFTHLSLFNPSTVLCHRNCYVHFMGKETESREVINLFKVSQGSGRARIQPQTILLQSLCSSHPAEHRLCQHTPEDRSAPLTKVPAAITTSVSGWGFSVLPKPQSSLSIMLNI